MREQRYAKSASPFPRMMVLYLWVLPVCYTDTLGGVDVSP